MWLDEFLTKLSLAVLPCGSRPLTECRHHPNQLASSLRNLPAGDRDRRPSHTAGTLAVVRAPCSTYGEGGGSSRPRSVGGTRHSGTISIEPVDRITAASRMRCLSPPQLHRAASSASPCCLLRGCCGSCCDVPRIELAAATGGLYFAE